MYRDWHKRLFSQSYDLETYPKGKPLSKSGNFKAYAYDV